LVWKNKLRRSRSGEEGDTRKEKETEQQPRDRCDKRKADYIILPNIHATMKVGMEGIGIKEAGNAKDCVYVVFVLYFASNSLRKTCFIVKCSGGSG